MDSIGTFFQWFAGGNRPYMTLYHCMAYDVPWVIITVALDLSVALGYGMIAVHWWKNQRGLQNDDARRALGRMRNIFIFCGLCGYLFIPIKMVWPAWRLYDMFLLILVWITWRYAWNARDMKVVYRELGRSTSLSRKLEESQAESRRKSLFLNAISHDLRNPLFAMLLQTEAALSTLRKGSVERTQESLDHIRQTALHARDLLENMLEFARADWIETVQKSSFDAVQSVAAIVESLRPQARSSGIALELQTPPTLHVTTDRPRIERATMNIVQNAIKYTKVGSVCVNMSGEGDTLRIEVIDTGPGIKSEHLEHLFDEFYQIGNDERNRAKGFGLGLAIARRLVDQLGGEIRVQSRVGAGSRFTLLVPGACRGADAESEPDPLDDPGLAAAGLAG